MEAHKRKHPTFRRFPWLPVELRLEIWKYALPVVTEKATLYPWVDKVKWKREYVEQEHPPLCTWLYYPDAPTTNQIAVPLLYVNHESRSVALEWLNQHRPLRKRYRHKGTYLLTRPLIPPHDTLYLANAWFDPASPDRHPWRQRSLWMSDMRIAISESVTMANQSSLCDLVDEFHQLNSIAIVVDSGPNPYSSDLPKKEKLTERWEIEGPRETILKWDAGHGEILAWNPDGIISAALYRHVVFMFPRLCGVMALEWEFFRKNMTTIEAVRAVRR